MASHAAFMFTPSRYVVIIVALICVFKPSTQECEHGKFDCGNSRCLSNEQVCDYFDNCADGTRKDERNCDYPPADLKKALICIMNSRNHEKSYIQKLYGEPDDYAYKLADDSFAKLLPIHVNWIYWSGFGFLHSMAIDYDSQTVYCGNNLHGRLEYGVFVYSNSTTSYFYSFVPATLQMNGVAYDWVTKNVYFTDGQYKVIGVTSLSVANRVWKAIVEDHLSSPQSIAVNPQLHYLFWSDGTNSNAKIERSDLSGNSRTVLVSSAHGLVSPTKVVVDFSSQKLYWLDSAAEMIGRVNFDGSDPITWFISSLSYVSAMTVYRNYIYFGHNSDPVIYIYDKSSMVLVNMSWFRLREGGGITDMAMYASDAQPLNTTNPCATNNGGCSHFCWASSSATKVCECALGFFLALDGATCNSRPWSEGKMLIVADYSLHNIYQLNPDTGEVRAVPMSPCRPVRMTFDSESNFLYVICDESELLFRIQKKTFDGKIDKVIYSLPRSHSESQLAGIALDAERGLLYFTDRIQGIIAEMTTKGANVREIISDRSKHPRAIVVDSKSRRMYWSDCSGPATIRSARVSDGGDLQILISESRSSCIVDIAIDFDNKLIYWVSIDKPAVKMASLNGTGQATLLNESNAEYTGITLYNNCLYISDESRRNIIKFNMTSGTVSLQAPGLFADARDVIYAYWTPTPTTSSTPTTHPPTPPPDFPWMPVAVGVGGLLVLVVVIAIVIQVIVAVKKSRRPVTSTEPRPFGSNIFAIPMPNLSMSNPTECAVGGVDKECCGYEPLTEGNIYNSLDETPVVPSTATRPILSSKSTTRESRDENGYLKCRDSSA